MLLENKNTVLIQVNTNSKDKECLTNLIHNYYVKLISQEKLNLPISVVDNIFSKQQAYEFETVTKYSELFNKILASFLTVQNLLNADNKYTCSPEIKTTETKNNYEQVSIILYSNLENKKFIEVFISICVNKLTLAKEAID